MAPNSVRSVEVAHPERFGEATSSAGTIAELISTIPQTWRPELGAHLTQLYRVVTKLTNVQNTIAQYDRHQTGGSFPASITNSIRDPKVQYSKEYRGTTTGTLADGLVAAEVHNARTLLLDCVIKRKKEELVELQRLSKWDAEQWRKLVGQVAGRMATAYGTTVGFDASSAVAPKWGTGTQGQLQKDCNALWAYGDLFHYRTIAIARSIADRTLVEKTRNLKIVVDTDHVMKDKDSEKPTIELIRDENKSLEARLKSELARMFGNQKKSTKPKNKKGNGGKNNSRVGKKKASPKGAKAKKRV